MSQYYDLKSLKDPDLYLAAPISLCVSGHKGNWVAFWEETQTMAVRVEGEGEDQNAAMEDCRSCLLDRYKELETKLKKGHDLAPDEDRTWIALCHHIGSRAAGKTRPGEEYNITYGKGPDFKGPIYG